MQIEEESIITLKNSFEEWIFADCRIIAHGDQNLCACFHDDPLQRIYDFKMIIAAISLYI